jgi:hypothetical protein
LAPSNFPGLPTLHSLPVHMSAVVVVGMGAPVGRLLDGGIE